MSALTALARAEAADLGRARLIRAVRHVHVSARPLVFIPLEVAGEACAPIAAMVGDDPLAEPGLLVVPGPLNRDERFRFAAELAEVVLRYIDSCAAGHLPGEKESYPDAPQLIVPNAGGVRFTGLLGRSTRFRRVTGEWAVPRLVPELGRWLTFFAERAQHPGSCLLLAATRALSDHWATGQSATEDQNLAALLAWIDPPPGLDGATAARRAEDDGPPAGPATDPEFDREVLRLLYQEIQEAQAAGDAAAGRRARLRLERELRLVLRPTWDRVWQAIGLLRSLPEGGHVAERWKSDRWSFTGHVRHLREGGFPQAKRDGAVAAARKLSQLESEQQSLDAQMAYDDPLVMAESRMAGQAFAGTVTRVERRLVDGAGTRKKLRPWVWVETTDEVAIEKGATVGSPARPTQAVILTEIERRQDRTLVTLELQDKMGPRPSDPTPGAIPDPGDRLTYAAFRPEFRRGPEFPAREDTPWTHGGPPREYVPTEQDAAEPWDGAAWDDRAWPDTAGEGAQ